MAQASISYLVFDCHVHLPSPRLGQTWEWSDCTPDLPSAIHYLRHCGVERVLANSVLGQEAKTPAEMVTGNDEIAAIARDYPGFVVPTCLINTNFPTEAQAEIRRCHDELRMVWIGELCDYVGGFSYTTPAFADAVGLATELGMVVQIHDEDVEDVDRLCTRFPHTTLVLAHLGDSPQEVAARIALAGRHPNLYLDISGHGHQRMGVLELAVRVAGPDRVLFGSDYTINDPAGVIARILKADLDDETRHNILGRNLLRLLAERGVTFEH